MAEAKKKAVGFLKQLGRLIVIFLLVIAGIYIYFNYFNTDETATQGIVNAENPDLTQPFSREGDVFIDNPVFSEQLDFTINLADRRRFLKLTLNIGMSNQRVKAYLQGRLPIVKDIIISSIQYKTALDLETPVGVEKLKGELIRRLNRGVFPQSFINSLPDEDRSPVKKILISQFILQ